MQPDRAKDLFHASGFDFEVLKKAALSRDVKPLAQGPGVSFSDDTRS